MRHIVAIGGGGFGAKKPNLAIDRYILRLTGRRKPRVCFIPTASGEAPAYIRRFHRAYGSLGARTSVLTLIFQLPTADLEDFLLRNDAIYVGGGNTKSMLALWREWGVDALLRKAWRRGIVLAGISAGANCWFESCSTDSWPGELRPLPCLGFLRGAFCPHYDAEAQRRPTLHRFVRSGKLPATLAAEDGTAAHFVNGKLHAAVTYRRDGKVYRVARRGSGVAETAVGIKAVW